MFNIKPTNGEKVKQKQTSLWLQNEHQRVTLASVLGHINSRFS